MKLLVLSDTHGRRDRVERLLELHSDATCVLFLGDGLREVTELCEQKRMPLRAVRGNCDFFGVGSVAEEQLLTFGAYTVLMMHGHTRGVKAGLENAVYAAAERGADLLLYGHTHIPIERYLFDDGELRPKPLWVFNPGSLGNPASGNPSYGLIQIRDGGLLLSHGSM